ncbi:hypothetical protein HK405_001930, partial [Cladochytrium tenue]
MAVRVVYGTAGKLWTSAGSAGDAVLDVLAAGGVRELDSARIYADSELRIHQRNA